MEFSMSWFLGKLTWNLKLIRIGVRHTCTLYNVHLCLYLYLYSSICMCFELHENKSKFNESFRRIYVLQVYLSIAVYVVLFVLYNVHARVHWNEFIFKYRSILDEWMNDWMNKAHSSEINMILIIWNWIWSE